MRNVCFKKGLVVGIIVLFLSVGITSSGININIENESEDKSESSTLDEDVYEEIIYGFPNPTIFQLILLFVITSPFIILYEMIWLVGHKLCSRE